MMKEHKETKHQDSVSESKVTVDKTYYIHKILAENSELKRERYIDVLTDDFNRLNDIFEV